MMVTAKHARHAALHVDHLGLLVDVVVGELFGSAKGAALREHGATVYVGDHVHDVAGARPLGRSPWAWRRPCSAQELLEAGADVVLDDLSEFPAWLDGHLLARRLDQLTRRLQDIGSLVVAFSGGADSALLMAAAVRALGPDRVVAATALSDSLPAAELEASRAFCAQLGVRHLTPRTMRWSGRATAPTRGTGATSARPSCSTFWTCCVVTSALPPSPRAPMPTTLLPASAPGSGRQPSEAP